MSPCETASTITAIACALAKCIPKEDLPILTAALGQLASTLATIAVQEESLNKGSGSIPPSVPTPESVIVAMPQS